MLIGPISGLGIRGIKHRAYLATHFSPQSYYSEEKAAVVRLDCHPNYHAWMPLSGS